LCTRDDRNWHTSSERVSRWKLMEFCTSCGHVWPRKAGEMRWLLITEDTLGWVGIGDWWILRVMADCFGGF
jgi:hypothetical protein